MSTSRGERATSTEVWLLALDRQPLPTPDAACSSNEPLESPDERRHALRLRSECDRNAFLISHRFLREMLARRLHVPSSQIAYRRAACVHCGRAHGRPELLRPAAAKLRFSLARSGVFALVALADGAVGADIEAVPDRKTALSVCTLLHAEERATVLNAPRARAAATFAQIWTRKEALVKASGAGICADLAAESLAYVSPRARHGDWMIWDLELPAGYAGAVAVACRGDRAPAPAAQRGGGCATQLSSRLSTLPVGLRGSSPRKQTSRGTL